MGLCQSMAARVLDRIFGNDTSWSQPTGSFLALSRTIPYSDISNLDELSIGAYGYNRVQIDTSGSSIGWSLPEPTGGNFGGFVTYNTGTLIFPEATGEWGTLSHFVVFDHATSGGEDRALMWGYINTPKYVDNGDTIKFLPETLRLRQL